MPASGCITGEIEAWEGAANDEMTVAVRQNADHLEITL